MIRASACLLLPALLRGASTGALAEDARTVLETRVLHTPWLGLRIEQNGREVPLVNTELRLTEAQLESAPFTIVLPVRSDDDLYRVTAWWSPDIFETAYSSPAASPRQAELPPYFRGGTGMADTAASSGTLMLNQEAHHYLTGLRLGPDTDRHLFHASEVLTLGRDRSRVQMQMEQVDQPIYIVTWFDENGDNQLQHSEYDFLILNFSGAS